VSAGERLVVGQVRGFHGLKGTVRVESLTDRAEERFAVGRYLFREGGDAALTVVEASPDSLGWRLRFKEVPDRTSAESLRDVYLEAVVAPGEELARGEFYWHEVIGARVTDTKDVSLGEVVDMYRAGGAEVIVVRGPVGEIDVPLVRAVVRIFAPARGEIVVDLAALGLDDRDGPADEASADEVATGEGATGEGAAGGAGTEHAADGPAIGGDAAAEAEAAKAGDGGSTRS
jgi:16S rRNA processing protein RimM